MPALQKVSSPRTPPIPLIIEAHPVDYSGYPFLTLVQYRKTPMLGIIDNVDNETIKMYVLDLSDPEDIDKEMLFRVASDWYDNNRGNFPISIAFSMLGLTPKTSKIYRVLHIDLVSRVIGPAPKFPMSEVKSVRRRRKKLISQNIEIVEVEEEIF